MHGTYNVKFVVICFLFQVLWALCPGLAGLESLKNSKFGM
jgi:hypothetical protein